MGLAERSAHVEMTQCKRADAVIEYCGNRPPERRGTPAPDHLMAPRIQYLAHPLLGYFIP